MKRLGFAVALALVGHVAVPQANAQERQHPAYDYPTSARADYVIGCLAHCSCVIDTIAIQISYEDYEKADTILRMQQGGLGERGAVFRDTPIAKEETEKLRRAQAEANLRCH